MSLHEIVKFGPQKRPRKGQWIKCQTCGKIFYVYPSRIRQAAKRGGTIRYCSMKCYDKTGDKNPFWGKRHSEETRTQFINNPNRVKFGFGEHNPNAIKYGPDFRGISLPWWRDYFRRSLGHCEQCGYSTHVEILQIHHTDRNKRNNTRSNLLFLCPNCHESTHFLAEDGRYHH